MRELKCCGREDFAGFFINLGPDTVWFNKPYTDCPDQGSVCLIFETGERELSGILFHVFFASSVPH